MKKQLLAFTLIALLASCASSRQGCPGTSSSGPRYKAEKFSWPKS